MNGTAQKDSNKKASVLVGHIGLDGAPPWFAPCASLSVYLAVGGNAYVACVNFG